MPIFPNQLPLTKATCIATTPILHQHATSTLKLFFPVPKPIVCSPPTKLVQLRICFCFAALADATTGTMFMDLTGAFPVRSFKNKIYIFFAYIYDLNTIIVSPMALRTDASFIAAFTKVFAILHAQD